MTFPSFCGFIFFSQGDASVAIMPTQLDETALYGISAIDSGIRLTGLNRSTCHYQSGKQ